MRRILASVVGAGLIGGVIAWIAGARAAADLAWIAVTVIALVPLTGTLAADLWRRKAGVDLIAVLAMAGALALGEYLAGAVVALMMTGGQALEDYAGARARRELSALIERMPSVVQRHDDSGLRAVPLAEVRPNDRLLVAHGDIIPVDGVVLSGPATLDTAALTGEARPVDVGTGERVSSGVVNVGGPFDLRAVSTAEESTYAGIVRLVQQAQASKAPLVRLADRYAVVFLVVTFVFAGGAWLLSGDPVRALAVLVVATPCPLILAAPVAIVAGISRSAQRGIIVKGGGALETLARVRLVLFDKTGTLTGGMPTVDTIETFGDVEAGELLRLAASLDQVSPHVLADPIVKAAADRDLALSFPQDVTETAGQGIRGRVDEHDVAIGSIAWLLGDRPAPERARALRHRTALEGSLNVFVTVDGELAGALVLSDPIRPDAPRAVRTLRRMGIEEIVIVTGDHPDVAASIGAAVGADLVLAERSPADKVEAVQAARARAVTLMVGDGINDAPALAAAHVGIAMGGRRASASSDAADVVLTVDQLDRVPEALRIARRSRDIALQSILVGMGLSIGAMGFAAAGLLVPVAGAFLQEGIDVAVILNALRALRGERRVARAPEDVGVSERFLGEHQALIPSLDRLRAVADRLDVPVTPEIMAELEDVRKFLVDELVPHEEAEDELLYPLVAKALGGEDPMGPLSRTHLEISHLIRLYARRVATIAGEGPGPDELRDLRRILYSLHAVLKLHFAQEEEAYRLFAGEDTVATPA